MHRDVLDSGQAFHLLHQAESLESEGRLVLADLNLLTHLSAVGNAAQIGSSILGLMVWCDLDFCVISPGLATDKLNDVVRSLMTNPRINQVRVLNEGGPFNISDQPQDERYYIAAHYFHGKSEWKIDISFWLHDAPRPEVGYADDIRQRLTSETRLAILWIKDAWHKLPTYRREVGSMDIYAAVLDHGVRTPTEFQTWLDKIKSPSQVN